MGVIGCLLSSMGPVAIARNVQKKRDPTFSPSFQVNPLRRLHFFKIAKVVLCFLNQSISVWPRFQWRGKFIPFVKTLKNYFWIESQCPSKNAQGERV